MYVRLLVQSVRNIHMISCYKMKIHAKHIRNTFFRINILTQDRRFLHFIINIDLGIITFHNGSCESTVRTHVAISIIT